MLATAPAVQYLGLLDRFVCACSLKCQIGLSRILSVLKNIPVIFEPYTATNISGKFIQKLGNGGGGEGRGDFFVRRLNTKAGSVKNVDIFVGGGEGGVGYRFCFVKC